MTVVTKSDYKDGDRGYYYLIEAERLLGKGFKNANRCVQLAIKNIMESAYQDGYHIEKFYNHKLKDGSEKVYGVGYYIKAIEEEYLYRKAIGNKEFEQIVRRFSNKKGGE